MNVVKHQQHVQDCKGWLAHSHIIHTQFMLGKRFTSRSSIFTGYYNIHLCSLHPSRILFVGNVFLSFFRAILISQDSENNYAYY